jgi:hypothetical protein
VTLKACFRKLLPNNALFVVGAIDRCDKGLSCRRREEQSLSAARVGPFLSRQAFNWRLSVDCSESQRRGSGGTTASPLQQDSRQLGGNVSTTSGGLQTSANRYTAVSPPQPETSQIRVDVGASIGGLQASASRCTTVSTPQQESSQLGADVGISIEGVQTSARNGTASTANSPVLFTRSKEESRVVRTAWEKLVRWSKSWQLLQARRQGNALQNTTKVSILSLFNMDF